MVFLELAECFLSLGSEVVLYSNLALPPMLDAAKKLPGSERLHIVVDPEEDVGIAFDLIFMHDNTLPDCVVDGLERGIRTRIVPLHLSGTVPIEMPLFARVENNIADVIACVSPRVVEHMTRRGLRARKCWVMENFVSEAMAHADAPATGGALTSVAIVSNNVSDDVSQAADILRQNGVRVDHFGASGGTVRVVDGELLSSYDAIVAIGKTVQYGLALGIPVYVYDHFGGEGWLRAENFERELRYSFSGRATFTKKKTSADCS